MQEETLVITGSDITDNTAEATEAREVKGKEKVEEAYGGCEREGACVPDEAPESPEQGRAGNHRSADDDELLVRASAVLKRSLKSQGHND